MRIKRLDTTYSATKVWSDIIVRLTKKRHGSRIILSGLYVQLSHPLKGMSKINLSRPVLDYVFNRHLYSNKKASRQYLLVSGDTTQENVIVNNTIYHATMIVKQLPKVGFIFSRHDLKYPFDNRIPVGHEYYQETLDREIMGKYYELPVISLNRQVYFKEDKWRIEEFVNRSYYAKCN